jgi:hypothetical protein
MSWGRMGRNIPTSAVIIPGVTGAYSAFSALGSAFEIPNAIGNQGSLIVQLNLIDRATGMGGMRVHFYNQVPPAIADKSGYTIPSGQENSYLGYIDVSSGYFVTAGITGGNTAVEARVIDQHQSLYNGSGNSRSVWAQCQSLTAQTFGGLNSAQTIRLITLQD